MTKTLKLLLIIGAATAVAALLVLDNLNRPGGGSYLALPSKSTKQTAPTGSVDNAANDILEDVSVEEALTLDADADAELYANDSQEIKALGETYNETEF